MDLNDLANQIRRHCLMMTHRAQSPHIGSCLSCADILAALYGGVLAFNPKAPDWKERDRFILSKGHAAAAVYSALALVGFYPEARLQDYCGDGSVFGGHLSRVGVPGVEVSSGSLGHGLGYGLGIAQGRRISGQKSRVFVLMSDGECDEGSVWEAALLAAHLGLNSVTAIVDANGLQSMDTVENTVGLEPLGEKWASFGWEVTELDGHSPEKLVEALNQRCDRPHCVIARTIKGKGVSFMENEVLWHYRAPDENQLKRALEGLG